MSSDTTLEDEEVLSCVWQSLAVAPLLDIASDMDIQVRSKACNFECITFISRDVMNDVIFIAAFYPITLLLKIRIYSLNVIISDRFPSKH